MNDQPWTYIYATKEQPELWNKLFDALNDSNKVWAAHAPLLVLSLVRKNFSANGHVNKTAAYDLGGANAFLTLQGVELGLHTHQMGGYDHQKAITNLNIPDSYELGVMMAIGYNGDPETLADHLKVRELAPRHRYTQESFVMNRTFENRN